MPQATTKRQGIDMIGSKKPIRIDGDIAYVTLSKGYEAIIDAADISIVECFSWCAVVQKNNVYAMRKSCGENKRRSIYLHRAIMGEPHGLEVDHIDGNGLSNQRINLRHATTSQNCHNQGPRRRNTSGFKGVSWNNRDKKWQAKIGVNGKLKHLGVFDDPQIAHAAYCKAASRLHGEFARTA